MIRVPLRALHLCSLGWAPEWPRELAPRWTKRALFLPSSWCLPWLMLLPLTSADGETSASTQSFLGCCRQGASAVLQKRKKYAALSRLKKKGKKKGGFYCFTEKLCQGNALGQGYSCPDCKHLKIITRLRPAEVC